MFDQLQPAERDGLRAAMERAAAAPDSVQIVEASLDGKPRLLALSYIAPLRWYLLTAVDLHAAQVLEQSWLWPLLATLALMLGAALLGFAFTVERLLLRPQRRRAAQVRRHTSELEGKVRERTRALEQANREMAAAHKQIDDSIDYASLIQRAILPDREMTAALDDKHFVLWQPRDVVGGDFYLYREQSDGCLLGVVDCAGHGVPGALMTMLARAAIDHAIGVAGAHDPAAILRETDRTVRGMLHEESLSRALATNMDAGLVWIDRAARRLRFSGARIGLFASDGQEVCEYKGGRRALADKRQGEYDNLELELQPGWTYYLCTDGFLDQAGGEHGFGFGSRRFGDLLRSHARLPLAEQAERFVARLEAYRGDRPQRDDITILSFRFD